MTRFDAVQELSHIILSHYRHDKSTPNGRVFEVGGGKMVSTEEFAKRLADHHTDLQDHRLRGVIDDIHRILRDTGFQLKTHESSQSDPHAAHSHSVTVTLPDGKELMVTVASTDPDPAVSLTLIETTHTTLHPIQD